MRPAEAPQHRLLTRADSAFATMHAGTLKGIQAYVSHACLISLPRKDTHVTEMIAEIDFLEYSSHHGMSQKSNARVSSLIAEHRLRHAVSPLWVVDVNGLWCTVQVPCQDDLLLLAQLGQVL